MKKIAVLFVLLGVVFSPSTLVFAQQAEDVCGCMLGSGEDTFVRCTQKSAYSNCESGCRVFVNTSISVCEEILRKEQSAIKSGEQAAAKVVDTVSVDSAKAAIADKQTRYDLKNPIDTKGRNLDAAFFISLIIKTIFGLLGALTLLMLVWGGFQWLTSAGNSEKVSEGTETMKWAILGVVLVFASYVLVDRVFSLIKGG